MRMIGLGAAACAAAALLDHYGSVLATARIREALRASPDWQVGAIETDASGDRLILRDVGYLRGNLHVTLGRVDLPAPQRAVMSWVLPAYAKIGVVHAHDIRIEGKNTTIAIPDIEVHGATLGSAEIAALFNPHDKEPTEARLAKVSFATVKAPEVTVTPVHKPGTKVRSGFTVHDVILSGGAAGRIKTMLARGISSTSTADRDDETSLQTGKISVAGVDLPLALKIQTGSRAEVDAPLKPVFDSFSIEAVQLKDSGNATTTIGTIQSLAMQARPPLQPFAALSIVANLKPAQRTDEERQHYAAAVADAVSSFAIEHLELHDLSVQQPDQDGSQMVKLGKFAIDGYAGLKIHAIAVDNFTARSKEADVSLGTLAIDGFDQTASLDVLEGKTRVYDSPTPAQLQHLMPKFSDAALHDIHIKTPAKNGGGNSADGLAVVFDIPAIEVKIGHPDAATATNLSAHVQVIYDVAPTTPSPELQNLVKTGFDHFDVSSDESFRWDEAAGTAEIGGFSLVFKDLGTIKIDGTLSDVSPDVINTDQAKQAQALEQIKIRSLDLGLVNAGLAEKAFPLLAGSAGTSVPLLKAELVGQANVAIVKALGPGPTADQLTNAVTLFINTPKTLDVALKAPEGIDLKTLIETKSASDLIPKLSISAEANHGSP